MRLTIYTVYCIIFLKIQVFIYIRLFKILAEKGPNMKKRRWLFENPVKKALTLFLALAVFITMPGFSVLICAVDFTSEVKMADAAGGIISDMRGISGNEMSCAVYYTGSGWKSRVEKFKDDLTSGNVLLLSGLLIRLRMPDWKSEAY